MEKPTSRKYKSVMLAIVMCSLTACFIVFKCTLSSKEVIELFQGYCVLLMALCGVYQYTQATVDKKGGSSGKLD